MAVRRSRGHISSIVSLFSSLLRLDASFLCASAASRVSVVVSEEAMCVRPCAKNQARLVGASDGVPGNSASSQRAGQASRRRVGREMRAAGGGAAFRPSFFPRCAAVDEVASRVQSVDKENENRRGRAARRLLRLQSPRG